jgi:hypothetical protein
MSAIGILLMRAAFMDWRLAIVGYLALPAALVGGVLAAFWATGHLLGSSASSPCSASWPATAS